MDAQRLAAVRGSSSEGVVSEVAIQSASLTKIDRLKPAFEYSIRVVVLAVFGWYLYTASYGPYRGAPFDEVEASVRALNAGHPFQLSVEVSPGVLQTQKISEVYGDYGIDLLVIGAGLAGRAWYGPSFRVQSSLASDLMLVFFLATAAAMISPPIPLSVGVAGVFSFWALFKWGALGFYGGARYWGVSYVVVVCTVFAATAVKTWTWPRALVLTVLALLAGYAQLLRQEAGTTPYVAGLALIASAGLVAIAAWRRDGSDRPADLLPLARRAAAGGLLVTALNAAMLPIQRYCFSRAFGTPYGDTQVAVHGSGSPLYLSLGYVSNPYNIGWRDPIAELHARLIKPTIVRNADPDLQATLVREFRRIVFERPWVFVRNVGAKAVRVHQLVGTVSGANTGTAIYQPIELVRFYWAVPFVLLASLLIIWRIGTATDAVTWFTSLATGLSASAGALVIFPEYIGGVQGATVVLVCVLSSLAASLVFGRRGQAKSGETARLLIVEYRRAIGLALIAGTLFVAVQAVRYRSFRAQTAAADPLETIRQRGFRYAHVFNDLTVAQQRRLVTLLQASRDPQVARIIEERRGNLDLFSPQVLVRTPTELHLIAWLGTGFVPPTPRLFQGSTHASLLICGDCPPETTVNDLQRPLRWTMINDLEWQGRYRMFTVQSSRTLQQAKFMLVAADRVRALDPNLQPLWLVPESIARARLSFALQ